MVSIIIVNYNNFYLLRNCLTSLEAHVKDLLYEVIIVDNNSTEGDVCEIVVDFKNVKIIKNSENYGFAKANNKGFKEAKYEYILLLNNDTVFIENPFPQIFNFIESIENNRYLIGIKLLNNDFTFQNTLGQFPSLIWSALDNLFVGRLIKFFSTKKLISKINEKQAITKIDYLHGAFLFLRKSDYLELSGFDESFYFYHEDSDLCYRFKKNGGKIYYLTNPKIIHLGGASTKNVLWFHFRNKYFARRRFVKKHHNFLYLVMFSFFESFGMLLRSLIFFVAGVFSFNKKFIVRASYHSKLIFIKIK